MLLSAPFRPAADNASLYRDLDPWLVPGIIPENGVVILASAPKTGKTCFATAIARALAKGEPFLGEPLPQCPVLWCAHEETARERLLLHEGLDVEDPLLIAYPGQLPALHSRLQKTDCFGRRDLTNFDMPYVFQNALDVEARLIVIDCLHAAVEGANLADNAVARAIMTILRVWAAHLGVAVLVLHHLTKSGTRGTSPERFADSAQILAAASCHFFMDRFEETETRSRIVLQGKGRYPAPVARLELVSEGVLDYRLAEPADGPVLLRKLSAADKVVSLLEEGWSLTSQEVARRLGLRPGAVRGVLAELQSAGKVVSHRRPKENLRYALSPIDLSTAELSAAELSTADFATADLATVEQGM